MKIATNYSLFTQKNFALKKNKNEFKNETPNYQYDKQLLTNPILTYPNINFGNKSKFITQGIDDLKYVVPAIKKAKSVAVEFVTKTAKLKETNLLLKSEEKNTENNFEIPLVPVNRIDNSYLTNIRATNIIFYDDKGNKISERECHDSINPEEAFHKIFKKKAEVKGELFDSDYNPIVYANRTGIVRGFNNYDDVKNYRGSEPIIAVLETNEAFEGLLIDANNEDFSIPSNVVGVITQKPEFGSDAFFLDCLSHAKCRMDGKQIFLLADKPLFNKISQLNNKIANFDLNRDKLTIEEKKSLPVSNNKVVLDPIKMNKGFLTPEDEGFEVDAVGIKAFNLGKLQKISKQGGFNVPKFFVIPAGEFEDIKVENHEIYHKDEKNISKRGLYHIFCAALDAAYDSGAPIDVALASMQNLIKKDMKFSNEFEKRLADKINEVFGQSLPQTLGLINHDEPITENAFVLSARSTYPKLEDLEIISTQGMFSSEGGIRTFDELLAAIKKVWASKWGEIAYKGRREHSIPHNAVQPSVIVQEFVKDTDYIFTGYTRKIGDENKLLIDLSPGLTCNMQGNPYLFEMDRKTGEIKRVQYATKGRKKTIEEIDIHDKLNGKYVSTDYSNDPFNLSQKEYSPILKKVTNALLFIEKEFGNVPQDIEGGIKFVKDEKGNVVDVEIVIWQTRNVQLAKIR